MCERDLKHLMKEAEEIKVSHLTVGVNGDEFFEQTSIPTSPSPPIISGSSIVAAPWPKKYDDLSSAPNNIKRPNICEDVVRT